VFLFGASTVGAYLQVRPFRTDLKVCPYIPYFVSPIPTEIATALCASQRHKVEGNNM
jgi:hypothetical protein